MASESVLTIERMCNVYRVAADDPAPDDVRFRLDRLATDEVIHSCRSRLAEWMNDDDPSIWLIRSLDVDLAIDAGVHAAQQTGFLWGRQIALEIGRTIERGLSESVMHFANRAEYVARWIRDRTAGNEGCAWYYADFDSLRGLSQSASITEGILRESESTQIVLQLYRQGALDSVLVVLSASDAQRLYRGLSSESNDADRRSDRWVSRLLALWGSALSLHAHPADEIRLWAAARNAWEEEPAGLQYAIDNLLSLRDLLANIGSAEISQKFLLASIEGRRDHALALLAGCNLRADVSTLEFVRVASGGNPEWAGFVADVITPRIDPDQDESFLSDLGGVFLLAGAFEDLHIHRAIESASGNCNEPERAAAILRFLLAVRCCGVSRAESAIRDRAIAEFAAMPSNVTLQEMAQVLDSADVQSALTVIDAAMKEHYGEPLNHVPHQHRDYFAIGKAFKELNLRPNTEDAWASIAAAVLRNFANRLPGFARSSPDFIFQNFLTGTAQVRVSDQSVTVQMGQCPLTVVLRMAGAYRMLVLPWRKGEICLLAPPD